MYGVNEAYRDDGQQKSDIRHSLEERQASSDPRTKSDIPANKQILAMQVKESPTPKISGSLVESHTHLDAAVESGKPFKYISYHKLL